MKIAIITKRFPARSETFLVEHVVGLARRGHSVTVISGPKGLGVDISEVESIRRVAHVVNSELLNGSDAIRTLRFIKQVFLLAGLSFRQRLAIGRAIRELALKDRLNLIGSLLPVIGGDFDVLHVHYGFLALPLISLKNAGLVRGEVIVTWHGSDANQVPRRYGASVYQKLFANKAIHTVGSKFMWKRLVELGASTESVRQVRMGIDTEFFKAKDGALTDVRPLKVLSVGRLVQVKGHEYLVLAVDRLIKQGVLVELEIIGEGDQRLHLENIIMKLGIEDKVSLKGARDRNYIRDAMWKSHVFALTGVYAQDGAVEAQGVVLAEAQACGMPVIASCAGGVPESVLEGKSAILCEPGNIKEIVSALSRFVDSPVLVQEFGNAARQFVKLKFSNREMLENFEILYDEALGLQVS